MSLPDEKVRAMQSARKFLFDMLNPQATPRVPKAMRDRGRRVVKHYPFDFEITDMMEAYNAYRIRDDGSEAVD